MCSDVAVAAGVDTNMWGGTVPQSIFVSGGLRPPAQDTYL